MKNMLAMVMGVTAQTLARAPSIADGRAAIERRLMALAEAHNVVHEDAGGTRLHRIVECAVAPCHPAHIEVSGPDIRLSSRAALAIAMAFHELCTNAIKYGALSVETGRVAIAWRIDTAEPRLHLTWRERGGPTVRKPERRGFGSRVIEMSFRHQLDGSAEAAFDPSGVVWSFDMPLAALQDQ
jgi:two-component sensor histidine kinase